MTMKETPAQDKLSPETAEKKPAAKKTTAKKPAAKAAAKPAAVKKETVKKPAEKKPAAKKAAPKAKAPRKAEIYVQSPYGGNITPEEIAAKMPDRTEACFVRVDQNKIWWVRDDGETGFVWIWD